MTNQVAANFQIVGLKELLGKLDQMPAKISQSIERKAMQAAMYPTLALAHSYCPVGDDGKDTDKKMSSNIYFKTKTKKASDGSAYLYGQVECLSPHAHLVEYGHRVVTRYGRDTGFTATPNPFMLRAITETADTALSILRDEIALALQDLEDNSTL